MHGVVNKGVRLLIVLSLVVPGLLTAQPMIAIRPLVKIVTIDPLAYEDTSVPNGDIEAPLRPSRKAVFLVSRSGSTARSLTVAYSINGGALNGVDYAELSGRVTIPAGRRIARIVVDPIDDDEVERRYVGAITLRSETVVVRLRSSSDYALGILRQARVEIIDDDEPPRPPDPFGGYGGYVGSIGSVASIEYSAASRITDYFRDYWNQPYPVVIVGGTNLITVRQWEPPRR
jgi:hypothetical protein